jgi:hypothetical protein
MRLIKEVAQDLQYITEEKQGGGKTVYITELTANQLWSARFKSIEN